MELRTRALTFVALTAVVVTLGWALGPAAPASADEPHPGLEFSLAVRGQSGCDTTAGDADCTVAANSTFVVEVRLDSLPSGVPQYEGFDVVLNYSGVTALEDGSVDAWPECGFAAGPVYRERFVAIGCAVGVPPAGPSTYTGVIATNSFTCSRSGTVSLVHSTSNTDLVETIGAIHAEGVNTAESLLIDCGQGPPPAPTQLPPGTAQPGVTPAPRFTVGPSPTRLPPTEEARATSTARARVTVVPGGRGGPGPGGEGDEDDGGIGGAGIAIIVIVVVVAVGAAGGFGWLYLRRRQGQGP